MKQVQDSKQKMIQSTGQSAESNTDSIDLMLHSAYSEESVPQDVKIRLQNRLACQKVMETKGVSFWWLPATVMTVTSFAVAAIIGVLYVVININVSQTWMPNFLQFVSEIWLKIHLIALGIEVMISWLFTMVVVWKGNLVESSKLF